MADKKNVCNLKCEEIINTPLGPQKTSCSSMGLKRCRQPSKSFGGGHCADGAMNVSTRKTPGNHNGMNVKMGGGLFKLHQIEIIHWQEKESQKSILAQEEDRHKTAPKNDTQKKRATPVEKKK